MGNIIHSLKRMERLGGENSRLTQKAKEAADELAKQIAESIPFAGKLPEDYRIISYSEDFLIKETRCPNYEKFEEFEVNGSVYLGNKIYGGNREVVLQFAKDIANGLLDKFADFVEKKNALAKKSIEILNSAGAKYEI